MADFEEYKYLEAQGKKLEGKRKEFLSNGYNQDVVKIIDSIASTNRIKHEAEKKKFAQEVGQEVADRLTSRSKTFIF